MSNIEVDIEIILSNMAKSDKQELVSILFDELGETFFVELDINDVINMLDYTTQREIFEELDATFGSAVSSINIDNNSSFSNMDRDLYDDLAKLLEARDFLTPKQRIKIKELTNEKYID